MLRTPLANHVISFYFALSVLINPFQALYNDDINVFTNSSVAVRGLECVCARACVCWACVLTKVTVFSLHIFARDEIILTLKTDVRNTQHALTHLSSFHI